MTRRSLFRALQLLAALPWLFPASAEAAGFSHEGWTSVLERFVDERGHVDYAALARDRVGLDRYLARLAETSPDSRAEERIPPGLGVRFLEYDKRLNRQ